MGLTPGSDGSYPYTHTEGSDFAKNLAAPDIDFGVFHLYVADCKNTPQASQRCSTLTHPRGYQR